MTPLIHPLALIEINDSDPFDPTPLIPSLVAALQKKSPALPGSLPFTFFPGSGLHELAWILIE